MKDYFLITIFNSHFRYSIDIVKDDCTDYKQEDIKRESQADVVHE